MEQAKKNYTCTCDPERFEKEGDLYVYPRQLVVELPEWSPERKRRIREGLSSGVCIDVCIVHLIKELWDKGVETTGCCCGHNTMNAWVGVHQAWYIDMFKLGYKQRPVEVVNGRPQGLYTFFL